MCSRDMIEDERVYSETWPIAIALGAEQHWLGLPGKTIACRDPSGLRLRIARRAGDALIHRHDSSHGALRLPPRIREERDRGRASATPRGAAWNSGDGRVAR